VACRAVRLTYHAGNQWAGAQAPLAYQLSPAEILALADAPATSVVLSASQHTTLLLLMQNTYRPLAELSAPEMRLGGLRVGPRRDRTGISRRVKVRFWPRLCKNSSR